MLKKFCRVDQSLRVAVGLELSRLSKALERKLLDTPEVVEIYRRAGKNKKAYLNLGHVESYPEKFEIVVPKILEGVLFGEILLNNNRSGTLVVFGREGEDMPFWPTEENRYVMLRLYPHKEKPFNPVFARVDKGPETRFFMLRARWENGLITIEVDHDPSQDQIPYFLI